MRAMERLSDGLWVNAVLPTVAGADALALEGGRIGWVGRAEERPERYRCGPTLDCAGRAVLPGFVDAHTHFLHEGLRALGMRTALVGADRMETLERLAQAASASRAGAWVVGVGWDESGWDPPQPLTRAELDVVAPTAPLAAFRVDGHVAVVNSAALPRLPEDLDARLVDRTTGILLETAAFALSRATLPPREVLVEALACAADVAHRLGITSVHAMAAPDELPAYIAARRARTLRITVYPEAPTLEALTALGVDSGFGDTWLRLGGVKLFADGSIGAGNAAVGLPFCDVGGRGALNHPDGELVRFLQCADRAGLQTAVHAIGDRAIDQILRAHATAGTSPELRHRIEHLELPSDEHLDRAADLGLWMSMQPNFVGRWSGDGGLYVRRLGASRDAASNPFAEVLKRRIPLAFGSDGMPMNPLYGIHSAVNAPSDTQRISAEQAMDCYTRTGVYLSFEEDEKGRLAPGMVADMVVLDRDPRACPSDIRDLGVELTILGGDVVYRSPEGWGALASVAPPEGV